MAEEFKTTEGKGLSIEGFDLEEIKELQKKGLSKEEAIKELKDDK